MGLAEAAGRGAMGRGPLDGGKALSDGLVAGGWGTATERACRADGACVCDLTRSAEH